MQVPVVWSFASFVLLWALVNFVSAAAPQMRDAIFESVSMASQRRAAAETFGHALSLSMDYHQTKRSGALARTLDRGARAVDFLLGILVFNLAPTALQLVMAAGVLWGKYDWRFAGTAVATIALFGGLTFAISNWRLRHRRELNEADNEAAGRAVDALLNYETVKSFGAEQRAAAGYDEALGAYARASVKATTSLSVLNTVQSLGDESGTGGDGRARGSARDGRPDENHGRDGGHLHPAGTLWAAEHSWLCLSPDTSGLHRHGGDG